jgi:hypothetical protein
MAADGRSEMCADGRAVVCADGRHEQCGGGDLTCALCDPHVGCVDVTFNGITFTHTCEDFPVLFHPELLDGLTIKCRYIHDTTVTFCHWHGEIFLDDDTLAEICDEWVDPDDYDFYCAAVFVDVYLFPGDRVAVSASMAYYTFPNVAGAPLLPWVIGIFLGTGDGDCTFDVTIDNFTTLPYPTYVGGIEGTALVEIGSDPCDNPTAECAPPDPDTGCPTDCEDCPDLFTQAITLTADDVDDLEDTLCWERHNCHYVTNPFTSRLFGILICFNDGGTIRAKMTLWDPVPPEGGGFGGPWVLISDSLGGGDCLDDATGWTVDEAPAELTTPDATVGAPDVVDECPDRPDTHCGEVGCVCDGCGIAVGTEMIFDWLFLENDPMDTGCDCYVGQRFRRGRMTLAWDGGKFVGERGTISTDGYVRIEVEFHSDEFCCLYDYSIVIHGDVTDVDPVGCGPGADAYSASFGDAEGNCFGFDHVSAQSACIPNESQIFVSGLIPGGLPTCP